MQVYNNVDDSLSLSFFFFFSLSLLFFFPPLLSALSSSAYLDECSGRIIFMICVASLEG